VLLRVDKPQAKTGAVVLGVRGLSVAGREGPPRLDNISFEVRAGEIVGIAGVEGNGQTELIEALAGLVPRASVSGSITFGGKDITDLDARHRKDVGIAHVPEDRHRRGLLLDSTLSENAILGVHYRAPAVSGTGHVLLNQAGIEDRTEHVIREFDVRPPNRRLHARALSGGNQQKLIIGREMTASPTVLIAAHPTRGIDVGAQAAVWDSIRLARAKGLAVLLVSADLDELIGLSDTLHVILRGRIVAQLDPSTVTPKELGSYMTGAQGEGKA
jgi:general nucleoside transport system ATP-binding protein